MFTVRTLDFRDIFYQTLTTTKRKGLLLLQVSLSQNGTKTDLISERATCKKEEGMSTGITGIKQCYRGQSFIRTVSLYPKSNLCPQTIFSKQICSIYSSTQALAHTPYYFASIKLGMHRSTFFLTSNPDT